MTELSILLLYVVLLILMKTGRVTLNAKVDSTKTQLERSVQELMNAIKTLEDELDEFRKDSKTRIAILDQELHKERVDLVTHTEEEVEGRRTR